MSRCEDKDFRFYPIWELVSWLGLTSDEHIKTFEERCRFSASPIEKKIEEGLEVIKAAIFKRRIDSPSFQLDMLSTGAPRIDKENTNENGVKTVDYQRRKTP